MTPEEIQKMLEQDAGAEPFQMSERDWAGAILPDLDYEAQLIAIKALLQRNEEADKQVAAELKKLDEYARKTSGWRNERAIEEFGEQFYVAIYQSAAHSMAALGMIAPLFESLFFQAFQGIRIRYFADKPVTGHSRNSMPKLDDFWNCHFVYTAASKSKTRTDIVKGIMELADNVDLAPHLPVGLEATLEALFAYRNKMLHCGFEWPQVECLNFAKRIDDEKWKDWFSWAERSGDPWIFYMTEKFIEGCLDMIQQLLDSFGAYCKGRTPLNLVPIS